MWRISRTQTENTFTSFTIVNEFGMFYDNDNINSYDDVKREFINFTLDPEFEQEVLNQNCPSLSYIKFYLSNNDESIFLFSVELQVGRRNDSEYKFSFINFPESIFSADTFHNKEEYFIKLNMETKYYKFLTPDDFVDYENAYEEEDEEELSGFDEDDDNIPAIIEEKFETDNCSVCLKNKPNILNIPCLHLSQCEECEKIGRFVNCTICRLRIKRKVKI